jgi:predicted TIM-barrel fold metal-dependent hydrolase
MEPLGIDVSTIEAVDVHTHVQRSVRGATHASENLAAMAAYFGSDGAAFTLPEMATYYRERRMAFVAFVVDSYVRDGRDPVPANEEVAEQAALNADVAIAFASVDPGRGKAAVRMAERLIAEYGVKGFKFHPNAQAFYPNDPMVYPLYEVLQAHRVPALFHSGHTGVGAGERGGGGIRLKYSNPMFVDDVAVDFPDLPIVLAHPSFPWQDEAISVCLHKPNVYIDLSGWSPKYFPANLIQYANTLLRTKVLFGSDFPVITPDRWLADFAKAPFKDDVRPLILKDTAVRLLGLGPAAPAVPASPGGCC